MAQVKRSELLPDGRREIEVQHNGKHWQFLVEDGELSVVVPGLVLSVAVDERNRRAISGRVSLADEGGIVAGIEVTHG